MIRILLILMLLAHSAFSLYVIGKIGLIPLLPPFPELHTSQIFSDLSVGMVSLLLLFYADRKRKKRPLGPVFVCAVGTLFLGSPSPLLYLIFNKDLLETA